MAKNGVNLDALIPREDLAMGDGLVNGDQGNERLDIANFRDRAFFAKALRKPEFQRETVHWPPSKIVDLVSAFLDRQLIPAVILWRSGQVNFVVDGAHRLSALLAWIYDDYGDGDRSKELFGPHIPPEQIALARKTRTLIEDKIGKYKLFEAGLDFPTAVTDKQRARISNLSVSHFVAQWVPAVTAKAAEDSFFKINDAATPLDPTEKRILQARDAASAIAARAISHGGKGYSYWRDFPLEARKIVEEMSERIFGLLYKPPLTDGPIDTLDVPVAGRGYSVLPFVFDLVNTINDPTVADSTGKSTKDRLLKDNDGSQTVKYLKKTLKTALRITGKEPNSLGLHPVIYFYTRGGTFSPWSFLAWAKIVDSLFDRGRLNQFCEVRPDLERYLIEHKWEMTEIIHKNGSGYRSTPWLERHWRFVLDELLAGKSYDEIIAAVPEQPGFAFLRTKTPAYRLPGENSGRRISASTRTAAIWDAALPGAPRCPHCNSRYHRNSIHGDHLVARRDGGDGRPDNADITHPYCDSTYKDWKAARIASQPFASSKVEPSPAPDSFGQPS